MAEILPDCRAKDPKGIIQSKIGNWVPIYCANCGKSGGAVPEENMNFAFYLCDNCVEAHGKIAGTMMMPDQVFWERVRQEQKEKRKKKLSDKIISLIYSSIRRR